MSPRSWNPLQSQAPESKNQNIKKVSNNLPPMNNSIETKTKNNIESDVKRE